MHYFQLIESWFGPHTINRFASNVPTFSSQFLCFNTHGVDAFAQADWTEHNNYGNPPDSCWLLLQLAQFLREHPCRCTLVVPYWPAQPWLQELQYLAHKVIFLPRQQRLFAPSQGGNAHFLPAPPWDLVVMRFLPDRHIS